METNSMPPEPTALEYTNAKRVLTFLLAMEKSEEGLDSPNIPAFETVIAIVDDAAVS